MLKVYRQNLKEVLDDYKLFPGLAVNWVMFGPNNRKTRPENGGVMRAYTKCEDHPDYRLKTIVNNYFVETVASVHNQRFRCASTCALQNI